jgi:hypothetical protein
LLGFFLGLGIGAHALDELHGRPLRTGMPSAALATVGVGALVGAGVDGWLVGGLRLLPFIVVGAVLALAYNLEWLGGFVHNKIGLATSWGAFPVLTGYYAQHWSISVGAVLVAIGATLLTLVQVTLSTPARWLRRTAADVRLVGATTDGTPVELTKADLLRPLEAALRITPWALVALAVGVVVAGR